MVILIRASDLEYQKAMAIYFNGELIQIEHITRGAAIGGTGGYVPTPTLTSRGTSYVLVHPPTFTPQFILIS